MTISQNLLSVCGSFFFTFPNLFHNKIAKWRGIFKNMFYQTVKTLYPPLPPHHQGSVLNRPRLCLLVPATPLAGILNLFPTSGLLLVVQFRTQVQLSATKMITGLSIYTFLYSETRWTPLHVYALGARLWFYKVGNNSIVITFWIISYFKSYNNEFSKLFFTVCIKDIKEASHENIIEFNQSLNSIFFFKIGF